MLKAKSKNLNSLSVYISLDTYINPKVNLGETIIEKW